MTFRSKINKVFFIAEIGSGHEGNFKKAVKIINECCETETDAIKIQIYKAKTITSKKFSSERYKHFSKLELKINQYKELSKICRKKKKLFGASVWDENLVSEFDDYLDFFKVGSGDITHYELIREIVKTKKPIIFSTGLSKMKEIKNLLAFINNLDPEYFKKKKISILHCVTAYPADKTESFLGNIGLLKEMFNLPIGFSDHTIGDFVPLLSFLNGAEIIEKHFSDNINQTSFRDHQISFDKRMVNDFLEKINSISKVIDIKKVRLSKTEKKQDNFYLFRRSIFAKNNISKGQIINKNDLICLRPKIGICSSEIFKIIGKKAKRNIRADEPLKDKDF